jgi:hypothetical protein
MRCFIRSTIVTLSAFGGLLAVTLPSSGADSQTASPPGKPAATASATNSTDKAVTGTPLFDGKSLKGWKVTDFAGHGEVTVDPKFKGGPAIIFESGAALTGITWTNPPPKGEYEVTLDAMKLEGSDFFCGLTFPTPTGNCSFIVGGWGGGVVGISSLDSMDASENETTKFRAFEKDRWYQIRVRVTKAKIEAWIDQEKMVDVVTTDRKVSVRAGEIELAEPFGISAYQVRAALRDIRLRKL